MSGNFGDALVSMIGDFANLNRTPDAKAKSSELRTSHLVPRRHSLNLAVGVSKVMPPYSARMGRRQSELSELPTTSDLNENDNGETRGRRQTAPAIPDLSTFRRKMAKLRGTTSLKDVVEDEEDERAYSSDTPLNVQKRSSNNKKQPKKLAEATEEVILRPKYLDDVEEHRMSNMRSRIVYDHEHRGSLIIIDDESTKPMITNI